MESEFKYRLSKFKVFFFEFIKDGDLMVDVRIVDVIYLRREW